MSATTCEACGVELNDDDFATAAAWGRKLHTPEVCLETQLTAARVALSHVSGALVDSGVVVPADELRYGEAVRELTKGRDDRDEFMRNMLKGSTTAHAADIAIFEAEIDALRAKLAAATAVHAFPIMAHNGMKASSVPWALVAPHEGQAQKNHYQSLERLAQRGGLSHSELCAVLEDREWRSMLDHEAVATVVEHVSRFNGPLLRIAQLEEERDTLAARLALVGELETAAQKLVEHVLIFHRYCGPSGSTWSDLLGAKESVQAALASLKRSDSEAEGTGRT